MSALAAEISNASDYKKAERLNAMLQAMKNRGRYNHRIDLTGGFGLAHGSSLINGASWFHQEHLYVALDGRLDNRGDLNAALKFVQQEASTDDARLISAAYLRWGEDFPRYLLGDFAIILLDLRSNQVIAARDHFGVKPLYYAITDAGVFFASDQSALIAAGVSSELSQQAIVNFLSAIPNADGMTNYKKITNLPPGHTLTATLKSNALRRYWRLEVPQQLRSIPNADEELRHLLTQATECRVQADRPVGALLSGGLDSSSLTCIARDIRTTTAAGTLPTFSLVFDKTPEQSERSYIESVVATGSITPHFVQADDISPLDGLADYDHKKYGPAIGPGLNWSRAIYQIASKLGVDVLIDGHGGDEAISTGQGHLLDLVDQLHFLEAWNEANAISKNHGVSRAKFYANLMKNSSAGRLSLKPLKELRDRTLVQKYSKLSPPDFRHLRPGIVEQYDLQTPDLDGYDKIGSATLATSRHFRVLTGDLQCRALEMLDQASSAYGIEVRFPFWDKRVVEFCLSLPGSEKLTRGITRSVLKRSMKGIVPDIILKRNDKFDFTSRLVEPMLFKHGTLISRVLADKESSIRDYVDIDVIRSAYNRLLRGEGHGYDFQWVWRTACAAQWLDGSWKQNT